MNVPPNDHRTSEIEVDDDLGPDDDLNGFDDLDELDDGFDADPYGSFTRDVPFAHHVITPALLAGLSGAPLRACRTFHHSLFDRLDGVGGFDGIIATPTVVIAPGASARWVAALAWLHEFPAPDAEAMFTEHLAAGYDPTEASEHVVHTVNSHSLDLSSVMGTNPSMTSASSAALSESLYHAMRDTGSKRDAGHVDVLTDVALGLLAMTSVDTRLDGGAEVVDTGVLLEAARRSQESA